MKHFYLLSVIIYSAFVANAQTLTQGNHSATNSLSTNTPTQKISVTMEECVVLDSTFIHELPFESRKWVTRKTINEYNEKGNETSSILFHLDDSLKLWKKLRVESTIYFDLSKEKVDSWVENDSFKFQEKKKFKFDSDGKIFSTIKYDYDENCKQWKMKSIINTSRNSNPLKRSSIYISFGRNSDNYDLEQSFVTFNSNNQIIETVDLELDNESNEKLNNHHKTIIKYDSHGNRTSVINCRWIPKNNKFTNSYVDKLTTYKYDSKGRIIEEVKYNGFNKARKQLPQQKEVYSYDENGNKVELVTFVSDEKTNNWVLALKSNFKYNTYGLNTEISHYEWNQKTNEWHLTPKKELFYYSNHKVIETANPNSVTEFGIYPTTNGKTLKILGSKWGDNISIYDANNKLKLLKKNSPFPVTLDVSRLPKGTYTIKVSNKESVRIARLNKN
jgi:uncharacterized protein YkuJ